MRHALRQAAGRGRRAGGRMLKMIGACCWLPGPHALRPFLGLSVPALCVYHGRCVVQESWQLWQLSSSLGRAPEAHAADCAAPHHSHTLEPPPCPANQPTPASPRDECRWCPSRRRRVERHDWVDVEAWRVHPDLAQALLCPAQRRAGILQDAVRRPPAWRHLHATLPQGMLRGAGRSRGGGEAASCSPAPVLATRACCPAALLISRLAN